MSGGNPPREYQLLLRSGRSVKIDKGVVIEQLSQRQRIQLNLSQVELLLASFPIGT